MSIELYFAFIVATLILIAIPGPNVALIIANSIAHGVRYGLLTVVGTSAAGVLQLTLTILGMTTLLTVMAEWFDVLRWAGVAYLLYLAYKAWTAPATDLTQAKPEPKSPRQILLRGFLVSLTNPKTLLFYGAFLPQFVNPKAPALPQFMLLAVTFIVLAVIFDSVWALLAHRFRKVLAMNGTLRNRLTGGFFFFASCGLALARKS